MDFDNLKEKAEDLKNNEAVSKVANEVTDFVASGKKPAEYVKDRFSNDEQSNFSNDEESNYEDRTEEFDRSENDQNDDRDDLD